MIGKRTKYTPLRSVHFNVTKEVITPEINDVLCGRGSVIHSHPGNQQFRKIITYHKPAYKAIENSLKTIIAREVVNFIRNLSPPGRYLSYEKSKKVWYEIPHSIAIQKTQQALREKTKWIKNDKYFASSFSRKETLEKKVPSSSEIVPTQEPSWSQQDTVDEIISSILGDGRDLVDCITQGTVNSIPDDICTSSADLNSEKVENAKNILTDIHNFESHPPSLHLPQSLIQENRGDQIHENEEVGKDMLPAMSNGPKPNVCDYMDDIDFLILSTFGK